MERKRVVCRFWHRSSSIRYFTIESTKEATFCRNFLEDHCSCVDFDALGGPSSLFRFYLFIYRFFSLVTSQVRQPGRSNSSLVFEIYFSSSRFLIFAHGYAIFGTRKQRRTERQYFLRLRRTRNKEPLCVCGISFHFFFFLMHDFLLLEFNIVKVFARYA